MKNVSISCFTLFNLAIFTLSACSGPDHKNSVITSTQAAEPHSMPVNKIPKEELEHYQKATAHFFDSLLVSKGFNGSILVAKNGTVIYEKYCGFQDPIVKKDTFTASDAFHLASVSKTFTAMGILKLREEQKISLEDTLGKFFPGFPYGNITVKLLLSHRSGLPNYTHYLEAYKWDKKKMVTNNDILQSFYTLHPRLDFKPGTHFTYCNTNYALLALIIEKISAVSLPEFLKTTFFVPLGMKDTYVYTPADAGKAMPSFEWNNRRFPVEFLDQVYGDKNVYSTVRDMLKWDQALYAGHLFTQQTLDSAFAPYSFEKEGKRNYGLGWRMTLLDNGKKLLYHNGWWHGNNTVFIRLIDENVTIIVLGNKFNRRIYSTKNLCDLFGKYLQHHESVET